MACTGRPWLCSPKPTTALPAAVGVPFLHLNIHLHQISTTVTQETLRSETGKFPPATCLYRCLCLLPLSVPCACTHNAQGVYLIVLLSSWLAAAVFHIHPSVFPFCSICLFRTFIVLLRNVDRRETLTSRHAIAGFIFPTNRSQHSASPCFLTWRDRRPNYIGII